MLALYISISGLLATVSHYCYFRKPSRVLHEINEDGKVLGLFRKLHVDKTHNHICIDTQDFHCARGKHF